MTFRIITPSIHGLLDYAAAVGLIVLPFLLDLQAVSPLAHWMSVVAGVGLVTYSLATDYSLGVLRLISFRAHLALDLVAAVVFALAPFVLGWTGLVRGYYVIMALGVLAVVALSAAVVEERAAATEI